MSIRRVFKSDSRKLLRYFRGIIRKITNIKPNGSYRFERLERRIYRGGTRSRLVKTRPATSRPAFLFHDRTYDDPHLYSFIPMLTLHRYRRRYCQATKASNSHLNFKRRSLILQDR